MATKTRAALHTPLCDLLGIRYPICQAGMAFVARSALAAAVSSAGGLGVIAAAHGTPALLRDEIRRVRDLTDKPFGVDVLFATIRVAGHEVEQFTDQVKGWVDVTLEERVPVLIAGLGNPGPVTAEAHRLGIKVMALCGNVKQARDHAANGVDVVIAQGHEAGGHTGRIGGMVLIPAVVDAVAPTPVVAAGGIADGRGLAAALMLGASGVLMGTRFYATHEAAAAQAAKERICAATGDDTLRSIVFDLSRRSVWPAPFTGRCLRNAHAERWFGREVELMRNLDEESARYMAARRDGDFDIAAVIAGESSGLVRELSSARDVVEGIVREASALLARGQPQMQVAGA
jgi:nitronate monooxygenase